MGSAASTERSFLSQVFPLAHFLSSTFDESFSRNVSLYSSEILDVGKQVQTEYIGGSRELQAKGNYF